jgi:DNA polymerase III subunit alpha
LADFVHLHTHSDFSLLDGAASVKSLVGRARELGMSSLALTDHGNMFGVMKFYNECRAQGVKPIVGCEVYQAIDSRHGRAGADKGSGEKTGRYYHLVLLAQDEVGYRNLLTLSSLAYTEGFYYRPRIDNELLEKHNAGLICLSACLAGEVSQLVLNGQDKQAAARVGWYREIFGDRYYLELQDHGIPEQRRVNEAIVGFSRANGIPLVATNDIHYATRDDATAQDVLICVGTNKKVSDTDRLHFERPEFYFKSGEQMAEIFSAWPDAIANTTGVAERCALKIPLPGPVFPDYQVPAGHTVDTYLAELAHKGLDGRYRPGSPEMHKRIDYELGVIAKMGFSGYFLIVWDFIQFALKRGIPVGPGRGSGVGSLVAYALHITNVDPLKYGLLFERFLTLERVSMPDFDNDFCFERRGEVIEYVTQKYGADRVSQIITFGTLKAKAVIRDVARVLDLPYAEADAIAKLVPGGPKVTLESALKEEPRLAELTGKSEKYRELVEISRKLEGLSRHASTHAAGIVIGREPLTHYVPLYKDPRTGAISTQYTMDYLEDCGLVKMDFLGLKTLTIINKACAMIRGRGIDFDIEKIADRDEATLRLFGEGRTTGIFQFESSGMQAILRRTKPDSIEDLIALNSLYRPGPMDNIDQFVESKQGKRKITYPLPQLEPILRETYGVIVYQEQVMQIAREVAGYTLGQADILRRAMGKKKAEVMEKEKKTFVEGALKKGYTREQATKIFDLLIPFAGYGFNKSHAAAYSVVAYQTAYLKANYPAEFMAANLTSEITDTDTLALYISEAREMGIPIVPPDINLSEGDFRARDGKIVYGLAGIKNVGQAAVDAIVDERRREGPYRGIADFLERVDLKTANRKVLETLVQTGVFDSFGHTRATLSANLDRLVEDANKKKENRAIGQATLFDTAQLEELSPLTLEHVEEWPPAERLRLEKLNLGFFFSGHPLDRYREIIATRTSLDLASAASATRDKQYVVVGVLREVKEILTRNGRRMAFATLEDLAGSIEVVVFPETFDRSRDLLAADTVVAARGKVDLDRGDPKLLAEEILDPAGLPERPARAVHVRVSRESDEPALFDLREALFAKTGKCALYLHLASPRGTAETVIQAAPTLLVSADQETLERARAVIGVEKVWTE